MTDLVARAVLNGDATGLVAASGQAAASLDKMRASARLAAVDGKAVAGAFDAAALAAKGQAEATDLAALAIGRGTSSGVAQLAVLEQLAAQGAETAASIGALSGAQAIYNSTVSQAAALLAAGTIAQDEYAKAVDGAAARLALARAAQSDEIKTLLAERDAAIGVAAAFREMGLAQEAGAAAIGSGLAGLGRQQQVAAGAIGKGLAGFGVQQTLQEAAAAKALGEGLRGFGTEAEHAGQSARALEGDLTHLSGAFGIGHGSALGFKAALDLIVENPIVAILVAGAAAAAAFAYEFNVLDNASLGVSNAVALTGNALGLTSGQIKSLTADIANAADVSEVSADAMAASFIRSRVDPSLWVMAAQAAKGYAIVIGKDVPDAAGDLVEKLSGGIDGLNDLEKQLGQLPEPIQKEIEGLYNSGHAADAMRLALINLKPELDAQKLSTFGAALASLEKHASNFAAAMERAAAVDPRFSVFAGQAPEAGDNVTADPMIAHMQQYNATINAEVTAADKLTNSVSPFAAQLAALDQEQKRYTGDIAKFGEDAQDAGHWHAALNAIGIQRQQVMKAERDAQLALNDELRAHLELVKRLVTTEGPQAVAAADADAAALEKQVAAFGDGAAAVKALQDQYEIEKETLPYVTAEAYAHGVQLQKLKDYVDALTAALERQHKAQNEAAALQDLHQQFSGLSDLEALDPNTDKFKSPDAVGVESSSIDKVQRNDAVQWFNNQKTQLDAWYAANKDTLANAQDLYLDYSNQLDNVFANKIAKIYTDDLARRTDWNSGVERGYEALQKDTANWAKTSEQLTKDASAETENDIIGALNGSKGALTSYVNFWIQALEKLLYQKYLASSVNSLLSAGLDLLGSVFGDPGSDAGNGAINAAKGAIDAGKVIAAGIHHTGGVAGEPASYRYIHPAYFDDAARYHTGARGIGTDLRPNEVPIIAEKGERIYTARQSSAIDAALATPVEVHVAPAAAPQINFHYSMPPGTQVQEGDKRPNASGGFDMDVLVTMVDQNLAQRNTKGRSAFVASMETTHSIHRGS